jgi:peptidoglycan/xylan/chitin deacetylase (PgdA/CDA1 family)
MSDLARKLKSSVRSLLFGPCHALLNAIDPPVIVLVYHRVAALPADPEMLAVTPENFRAQMRFLKENATLVRFEEDWSRVSKPAVVVTFDDGYADNALQALPILEELEVPATFFVSTGQIGTNREYWWHELERIALEGRELPARFTLRDAKSAGSWTTTTGPERQVFYQEVVRFMNDADRAHREEWLDQIRSWAGVDAGDAGVNRSLTVEELRRLAQSPWVTIGAHTVSHSRLASLPRDAQREEIIASKRELEGWLGRKVPVFSYPFGRRCDYTGESIALCREAGFAKAAANFPGQAHRWTDPYQIPRHLVRDWTVAEFAARLRGFWTR